MANSKRVLLLAVLCLFLLHEWEMHGGEPLAAAAEKTDCGSKCDYRCSKASRSKMCRRACNTCCVRCNCVPPGTSGNQDVCPCYANMTTHKGRKKCP